ADAPGAGDGESIAGKLQPRAQATSYVEAPTSPAPTAARATPAMSSAIVEAPPPPDLPPPMDELYAAPEPGPGPASTTAAAATDKSPVDKIKDALEAKGKMRVVAALDKGTVSIEGDYFCVAYAPEVGNCKAEIE